MEISYILPTLSRYDNYYDKMILAHSMISTRRSASSVLVRSYASTMTNDLSAHIKTESVLQRDMGGGIFSALDESSNNQTQPVQTQPKHQIFENLFDGAVRDTAIILVRNSGCSEQHIGGSMV